MSVHPLAYQYVASALVSDRLAEAATRTRVAHLHPVHDGDLATWLRRAGHLLTPLSLDGLPPDRIESIRELVTLLCEAAQGAGVETDLTPRGDDPPVVLMRILGALAGRTAGKTIPISSRQGCRLRAAMKRI